MQLFFGNIVMLWVLPAIVFAALELWSRTKGRENKKRGFKQKNPAYQLRKRNARYVGAASYVVAQPIVHAMVSLLFRRLPFACDLFSLLGALFVAKMAARLSLSAMNAFQLDGTEITREQNETHVREAQPLVQRREHGSSEWENAAWSDLAEPGAIEPNARGGR